MLLLFISQGDGWLPTCLRCYCSNCYCSLSLLLLQLRCCYRSYCYCSLSLLLLQFVSAATAVCLCCYCSLSLLLLQFVSAATAVCLCCYCSLSLLLFQLLQPSLESWSTYNNNKHLRCGNRKGLLLMYIHCMRKLGDCWLCHLLYLIAQSCYCTVIIGSYMCPQTSCLLFHLAVFCTSLR